ncbi:MAG: TerC/Alx family metal homeostasis membrane protein [Gemmatimonadetes bacterium]|nr:TerC/Alx family metal homeostasis membrane protein [Gemmatimonadota bacterium]
MLVWLGFLALVGGLLAFDLGVMNKGDHAPTVREAFRNTALFAVVALLFGGLVYVAYDHQWFGLGTTPDAIDKATNTGRLALVKYLTGYVVELSLSSDNVFVIALIFQHLRVPAVYQHRVLFWGVLGALVMRGSLIAVGASLVARFHWILWGFGLFLLYTAAKMLLTRGDAAEEPDENAMVRFFRRVLPVTSTERGHDFAVKEAGRWMLTPLAICLLLVETTDLLFAFDSIPAIFAITTDPFLVFTSNVFAILGLRSLYFALAGALDRFVHLKTALALILGIVGLKILASDWLVERYGTVVNQWLLALIAAILLGAVGLSLLRERRDAAAGPGAEP